MKCIILIGDGMADFPIGELDGKTPLQYADTLNMDRLAREGTLGMVRTVPEGYPPGSDVASMSILGYDPARYYTGRSPLEAASMGVDLEPCDLALRCNLVNLEERGGKIYMGDYSAGHISTDEAGEIIRCLDGELMKEGVSFYPGVSYRHLMVWNGGPDGMETTPPHDITGKEIGAYLPKGSGAEKLIQLMTYTQMLLRDHPVNRKREECGKRTANSVWLWGQGRRPEIPPLKERFGIEGSIISAVDLMNGIGIYAGLKVVSVPGVTGYLDTNYRGKAEYGLKELEERDLLCVHVEAPDEAGHNGSIEDKVKAIEDFDREIVGRFVKNVKPFGDYSLLVLCDHATPLSIRTHTADPVPFIIYPPVGGRGGEAYDEATAGETGVFVDRGHELLEIAMGRSTL